MKTLVKAKIIFILSLFIFSCGDKLETKEIEKITPNTNPEVVGYLPSYGIWNINNIDFSKLTQVLYFSLTPNSNGSLNVPTGTITNINQIKNAIGSNDIDILVSIGGWGKSENFPAMTSTETRRAKFIEELKDFCMNNQLKGADIDWEFPNTTTEKENFTILLMEMSVVFRQNNLIITSAQQVNSGHLEDEAFQYLNQVHVMAYDNGTPHSTYAQAVSAINHFVKRGVPRSKLILGVPFYGRGSSVLVYRNIYNTYQPTSDIDEIGGFNFNGVNTITRKTQYAIDEGLKGIMIWEISQDLSTSNNASLLKAIDDTKKVNQ